MFELSTPGRPLARDPWLLPLAERLALLARGRERVAYYYEEHNTSTFRYRGYNMAQVLNEAPGGRYSGCWFFREDLHAADAIESHADRLVVCRSGLEHRLNALMARFRARGKPVFFDVDDLVFDTRYAPLLVNTLGLDKEKPGLWDGWYGQISRLGATLGACDGVITTNEFLAERAREFARCPVAVAPNFMNREQLALSDELWAEKQAHRFRRDGAPTVGYFSGSPTHRLDFALAVPALARLMQHSPGLKLMLVGFFDDHEALRPFAGRIRLEPFTDWVNLQRLIALAELNLMPLQPNTFTYCKSALKYFEAAAVGTLSVASPTPNYAEAIADGERGWLARGHEWERKLHAALEVVELSDRYVEMAERAHQDAHARFTWTTQQDTVLRALQLL